SICPCSGSGWRTRARTCRPPWRGWTAASLGSIEYSRSANFVRCTKNPLTRAGGFAISRLRLSACNRTTAAQQEEYRYDEVCVSVRPGHDEISRRPEAADAGPRRDDGGPAQEPR